MPYELELAHSVLLFGPGDIFGFYSAEKALVDVNHIKVCQQELIRIKFMISPSVHAVIMKQNRFIWLQIQLHYFFLLIVDIS